MEVGPAPLIRGYWLRRVVGMGGFGRVHLASPEHGGPDVAIKVLHRVVDEATAARVQAEIQVMGTLAWHPNIVRILDAGTTDVGHPFIVMEYLARGSLGALVRDRGPLSWADVRAHMIQAATGLQVAHHNGLLHRDLKPDNVLLGDEGQVKLSDFGVSLSAAAAGTERGTTGTLAYSAPELLEGRGATLATDIYALGATMFALLTGQPAFQRDTDEAPVAMVLRAYREPVPDLRQHDVPDPMARVVERAMAKEPAGRPAAAQDLVAELQTAGAQLGVPPVPVVAPGRPVAAVGAAPAAAALPGRPSPEARARARRLQRITTAVGGVAAALVAVAVLSTSGLVDRFGTSDDTAVAPPAGEEPADADPAPGDAPLVVDPPLADEPVAAEPPPTAVAPPADVAPGPAVSAGELVPGQPQAGEITAGQPALDYTFSGVEGQRITLTMRATGGDLDPYLSLFGPDGALLAEDDDIDFPDDLDARITITLPVDGTYRSEASAVEGTGTFEILLRAG